MLLEPCVKYQPYVAFQTPLLSVPVPITTLLQPFVALYRQFLASALPGPEP
jgi:hypothetical protein